MTNEKVALPIRPRETALTIMKYLGLDLTFRVRAYINKRPALYFQSFKMLESDASLAVTDQTNIVISGIWGCANSFAATAFIAVNPGVRASHHLHVPAQVIRAVQLNIPCLVLVRHPVDALASVVARKGFDYSYDGFRWGLLDYTHYYESVIELTDHYIVSDFKEVITSFPAVVDRINSKFATAFEALDKDSELGREIARRGKSAGHLRAYAIDDIKEFVRSPQLSEERQAAERIYQQFCEKTGLPFTVDPPKPPKSRLRPKETPPGF